MKVKSFFKTQIPKHKFLITVEAEPLYESIFRVSAGNGGRPRGEPQETPRRPRGEPEETQRRTTGDPQETPRRPRGPLASGRSRLVARV